MLIGNAALVAGGGRGIGRATAIELARRGADVAFLYRSDATAAEETASAIRETGGRAFPIQCDVADAGQVSDAFATAFSELPGINMVVNSAGTAAPTRLVNDLSPEVWAQCIAVDLNGAYNVIHNAVRRLRKVETGGAIIAMSSIASQMVPPRNSCGAAAKAGVEALIRVTAREEARHNIRANVVSVGITDTDIIRPIFEKWGPETTAKVLREIPLGRIGQPKEVANMIAFLLSEDAVYVTGKVMQIDGGQFIGG
ncbi:SDR family NAD(P)-dependent oxidoreductase [Rhodoligotrophos ferricapiens]|uniref:SDR family NAD(P)-dependent oxidoreductase n=1 Tax=Rhodoligotrophos ferricapiens TaxID=3069264 RepID=UPI00315C768D